MSGTGLGTDRVGTPLYQELVRRYRRKRTPEEGPRASALSPWEDPAPDYIYMLIDAVLRRVGKEKDGGRALIEAVLAWVDAGGAEWERVARSLELQEAIRTGKGPRVPLIRAFLAGKGVSA